MWVGTAMTNDCLESAVMQKLIVSVSFGTSALSNRAMVTFWSWMVNARKSFFHCTNPGSEQERSNVTFRWNKQHVAPLFFFF